MNATTHLSLHQFGQTPSACRNVQHEIIERLRHVELKKSAELRRTQAGLAALRAIVEMPDTTERKQAAEKLRVTNAEVERFAYQVAHDLKSPLMTIKTFLGYLEKDIKPNESESVAKDLGFIRGAADKMERMLGELLKLARFGHSGSSPVEVPLQEIVKEALSLVAGQIAEREVEVTVTQKPIWLTGDRSRLVGAYQNLVDNAVKFLGDQPNPRIEIGWEPEGNENVFFVRDNGKGIDPRQHVNVFGLFEKLDASAPGSGMGLALVKRIVQVHGGRIWVESDGLGQGSSFRFTLAETRIL